MVPGLECMVMVLEPLPYPQLWQNHSPADDGVWKWYWNPFLILNHGKTILKFMMVLMVGNEGRVQGSRFRMNGNGTGTLSLSSALAKPFSS
jgi:hypothetical protein